MSRYIDADAFLKEYCEPYPHVYMAMSKAFADVPSIDIVRCKECKYYQDNQEGHYPNEECPWDKGETPNPDDFCSYGVKKGADDEAD